MAQISFEVRLSNFDKEAFDRLAKLDAERKQVVDDVLQKFTGSERYKAALDLAKIGNYGNKAAPSVTLNHGSICVSVQVEGAAAATEPRPYLNIGEKTLNALLQSKILTDAEKRVLISAATNGVIPVASAA